MATTIENSAKVFNEGCDARIAGYSKTSNPYKGVIGLESRWESGWDHVDTHWGREAKWPVKKLPAVRK